MNLCDKKWWFDSKEKESGIIWTKRLHCFSARPSNHFSLWFLFCFSLSHYFLQLHHLLCLQHTLKNEWQKLISYIRGNHCTHFRDGTWCPSGPGWSCDKMHAILIFLLRTDAILEFSYILDNFTVFLSGRLLEGVKKILQSLVHFTNALSL